MAAALRKNPPSRPHEAVGARIRDRRVELGLAVDDFRRTVELSQNHYYAVERGEKLPRDRKLARIATALGLRLAWVKTGEGERFLAEGESNGEGMQ